MDNWAIVRVKLAFTLGIDDKVPEERKATMGTKKGARRGWPTKRVLPNLPPFQFSIHTSWLTPFRQSDWQRMKSIGVFEKKSAETPFDTISTTAIVPPGNVDALAYFTCHSHVQPGKKEMHWSLILSSRPANPPPKNVLAGTKKVGGMTGLFNLVQMMFDASNPPLALSDVKVLVSEEKHWTCRLLPQAVPPNSVVADLGRNARLEEIGYRFTENERGLSQFSVLYDHEDKDFTILFQSNDELHLTCDEAIHIESAEDHIKTLLGRFFERASTTNG